MPHGEVTRFNVVRSQNRLKIGTGLGPEFCRRKERDHVRAARISRKKWKAEFPALGKIQNLDVDIRSSTEDSMAKKKISKGEASVEQSSQDPNAPPPRLRQMKIQNFRSIGQNARTPQCDGHSLMEVANGRHIGYEFRVDDFTAAQ